MDDNWRKVHNGKFKTFAQMFLRLQAFSINSIRISNLYLSLPVCASVTIIHSFQGLACANYEILFSILWVNVSECEIVAMYISVIRLIRPYIEATYITIL